MLQAAESDPVRQQRRRYLWIALLAGLFLLSWLLSRQHHLGIDAWVQDALTPLRTPDFERAMLVLTMLGGVQVTLPLSLGVALWWMVSGARFAALRLLAIVVLTRLCVVALKLGFERARPNEVFSGVDLYSFPSGHSASAVALYGSIAVLWHSGRSGWSAWLVGPASIALILTIGFSRLLLGAHWLTDVTGGFAVGGICMLAVLAIRPASWVMPPVPLSGLRVGLAIIVAALLAFAWYGYDDAVQRYGIEAIGGVAGN